MLHHVLNKAIKQRTVLAEDTFRRNDYFLYILKDIKGTSQIICKTFFSTTLGYEKTNDRILRTAQKIQKTQFYRQMLKEGKNTAPQN